MKIEVKHKNLQDLETELLIIYSLQKDKQPLCIISHEICKLIDKLKVHDTFTSKHQESYLVHTNNKSKRILVMGLGEKGKIDVEKVRKSTAIAIRQAKKLTLKKVHIVIPTLSENSELLCSAIIESAILTNSKFDKYLKEKDPELISLTLITENKKELTNLKSCTKTSTIIAENVLATRDFINDPSYLKRPELFIKRAKMMTGLKISVFKEKQLEKMKMNLLLAVGKGSQYDPTLLVLEYKGNPKSKDTYNLVGKGITFDSGGYNLKPSGYMETMRSDMSGAATVLYTIKTIRDLGLKLNLTAFIPIAENAIGRDAYKPGDVYRSHAGLTVEIGNTDAEGRLILADALSYSLKTKPKLIIDVATLTGACVVALGNKVAGMFSNNNHYADKIFEAGQITYERVWRMPIDSDYNDQIKGDIADLKNVGGKYAGAITAAKFLENFVENKPWIHLDIAGPSWTEKEFDYYNKHATGFGVRLLTEFFRKL